MEIIDAGGSSSVSGFYDDLLLPSANSSEFPAPPPAVLPPSVRVALAAVAVTYCIVFAVGIPANLYVLFRMRRLASSDQERYRNGTGIALCSMAAADLCSILLISAQNLHQMTFGDEDPVADSAFDPNESPFTTHLVCKLLLFLTHTVTSISIWSWLLLSTLRYLAICHPLYHLRLWQMPYRALAFIIAMSVLLNLWLLVAMESDPRGCVQVPLMRHSLTANRMFHSAEAIWSFCIPCVVIIVMDSSVVLKSTLPRFRLRTSSREKWPNSLDDAVKLTKTTSDRLKRRHQRALFKWLAVALACILLNTPENLYRIVMLFGLVSSEESSDDGAAAFIMRVVAQLLYYSQFAFNAIYLAVFVYDKSCRCRSSAAVETSIAVQSYHQQQPAKEHVLLLSGRTLLAPDGALSTPIDSPSTHQPPIISFALSDRAATASLADSPCRPSPNRIQPQNGRCSARDSTAPLLPTRRLLAVSDGSR